MGIDFWPPIHTTISILIYHYLDIEPSPTSPTEPEPSLTSPTEPGLTEPGQTEPDQAQPEPDQARPSPTEPGRSPGVRRRPSHLKSTN